MRARGGLGKHTALLLVLAAACEGDSRTVPVDLFVPTSCPLSDDAYVLALGQGDFERRGTPAGFFTRSGRVDIPLPSGTEEIVLRVSSGDFEHLGRAPIEDPTRALLLRERAVCELSAPYDDREGGNVVVVDERRVVISTGLARPGLSLPRSFAVDLGSGTVSPLARDLLRPRQKASLGVSDGYVIAAGGLSASGEPLGDAEIAKGDGYDRNFVTLSVARSEHGSVTLQDGRVLLVGGAARGKAVASLETIDPKAHIAETAGLATLESARIRPIVLRLANGAVVVAGGVDDAGNDPGTVETFTTDARAHAGPSLPLPLPDGSRAVALPDGGAVFAAPSGGKVRLHALSEGGELVPLATLENATEVALVPGVEGDLFVGLGARWLRIGLLDRRIDPVSVSSGDTSGSPVVPEPGLALFAANGRVRLLRLAVLSPYAPVEGALAVTDLRGLVPVAFGASPIAFSSDRGLILAGGERVAIATRTYRDFSLSFDSPAPPAIVLRDEAGRDFVIGGDSCPFAPRSSASFRIRRRGKRIEGAGSCTLPFAATDRVSIHLLGIGVSTSARSLVVARE